MQTFTIYSIDYTSGGFQSCRSMAFSIGVLFFICNSCLPTILSLVFIYWYTVITSWRNLKIKQPLDICGYRKTWFSDKYHGIAGRQFNAVWRNWTLQVCWLHFQLSTANFCKAWLFVCVSKLVQQFQELPSLNVDNLFYG